MKEKKRFNLVLDKKDFEIIVKRASDLGLSVSAYLRIKGLSK